MSWPMPSLTMILSGIFVAWMGNSLYTLHTLFNPTECEGRGCLMPSWKQDMPQTLFLAVSTTLYGPMTPIHRDVTFSLVEPHTILKEVSIPRETRNNGTLYLHLILTPKRETSLTAKVVHDKDTVHRTIGLTKYYKVSTAPTIMTHWRGVIHADVSLPFNIDPNNIPYEFANLIQIGSRGSYLPLVVMTDTRCLVKDLMPVDRSSDTMSLTIHLTPSHLGKLRFILMMEASFKQMYQIGFQEKDTDDVKGIFFDTNFFLLLLTVVISGFHLLFDFLAFKSDIQFWRGRKTMAGLSMRSLIFRFISQGIITVYLFDQKTSLLVLIPSSIGFLIEGWKVRKAWLSPRTSGSTTTDQLDSQFMWYLSWFALYPLVIMGSVYSYMYLKHDNLWSWVIESAANGVYAFGFLFMLPQLFINYKLKSVAHMPWKVFMYKAFNTFVDDVFAVLLTSLPTSHRVAAFRDDIVFFIYLIQRYMYPVDTTRLNEFEQEEVTSPPQKGTVPLQEETSDPKKDN